jgi:DNA-binding response OmpR family regulator
MAKILYVDDEPDIREVAQMSLELDPNLEVRVCSSGREAICLAVEWQPDLILLDVMMPEMDGPATLRALRETAAAQVPVLFITARSQAAEVEALLKTGAVGVIAKPFDPMVLAESVKAHLRQ